MFLKKEQIKKETKNKRQYDAYLKLLLWYHTRNIL